MYKILVADDEYLERKALRIILETRDDINNVKIIADAANGREAVRLAHDTEPDIIFMDIKMPGMDGLKAVKMIKDDQPDVKFVILTAYDEFEYVQQALNLGIKEYLLKPVKPEKVIEVVAKQIKQIKTVKAEEQRRQEMKDKLDMIVPYIKMSFVFDLVFLNIDTVEEVRSRTEFFDIGDLPSAVMIADIDKFARLTVNEDEVKRQMLKKEVFSVLKGFENKYSSLMVVPMTSDKIVILYFGEEMIYGRQIKSWLRQIGKEMCEEVIKDTDFTITIGIGNYYDDPRMMDRSYHEALGAIKNSLLARDSSIIHWEDIKNADYEEDRYPYDIECMLVEKLKSRKNTQLPELISTLFNSWQIDENFDSMIVKSRMLELLGVLSRSAVEAGAQFKEISPLNYDYTQKLLKVNSPEQLKSWLNSLVEQLNKKIDNMGEEFKEKIIYDGVKYVQSNYSEDISLCEAAKAANLSTHYFSRLFKKEMGCTFKEYITRLRMEEAKRKLNKTDTNIGSIAKEVGYSEPSYFSKVFKKYEGVSPSEYRN
ncbi:AraC family two component transcriptional regulator [Halanaerobium sp. DL-01]|uniref:helix-turn-helix domain-containing protein n=1 Tax=Halanaerobium sp. DL-01 TaxID=1653064 RepID=UPI000DF36EB2|nr:helix-turn-helix domain-containing protein [Halanaerobium sp. DL-01]RCW88045.1 AraC family two component transcriptional regulator [Halanaerobium sp. DL-01]